VIGGRRSRWQKAHSRGGRRRSRQAVVVQQRVPHSIEQPPPPKATIAAEPKHEGPVTRRGPGALPWSKSPPGCVQGGRDAVRPVEAKETGPLPAASTGEPGRTARHNAEFPTRRVPEGAATHDLPGDGLGSPALEKIPQRLLMDGQSRLSDVVTPGLPHAGAADGRDRGQEHMTTRTETADRRDRGDCVTIWAAVGMQQRGRGRRLLTPGSSEAAMSAGWRSVRAGASGGARQASPPPNETGDGHERPGAGSSRR